MIYSCQHYLDKCCTPPGDLGMGGTVSDNDGPPKGTTGGGNNGGGNFGGGNNGGGNNEGGNNGGGNNGADNTNVPPPTVNTGKLLLIISYSIKLIFSKNNIYSIS